MSLWRPIIAKTWSRVPVLFRILPHTVFDVVVDNEIELLIREAVVLGKHAVNFIQDWLGMLGAVH